MAKTYFACGIVLCAALVWPGMVVAGDVFTGYQIDHQGEYYGYLGVRTPITSGESKLQPFIQVLGAGLGYKFKDNGATREVDMQLASPSLGLKYILGQWNLHRIRRSSVSLEAGRPGDRGKKQQARRRCIHAGRGLLLA